MRLILSFLAGIILTLAVLACVGFFAVKTGVVPANADGKPANHAERRRYLEDRDVPQADG